MWCYEPCFYCRPMMRPSFIKSSHPNSSIATISPPASQNASPPSSRWSKTQLPVSSLKPVNGTPLTEYFQSLCWLPFHADRFKIAVFKVLLGLAPALLFPLISLFSSPCSSNRGFLSKPPVNLHSVGDRPFFSAPLSLELPSSCHPCCGILVNPGSTPSFFDLPMSDCL